jgi:hypothetical protein
MPNFAVIHNGFVNNVIVADDKESAEEIMGDLCVEYDNDEYVGLGMKYDEKTRFAIPAKPKGDTNAEV